jgi:hypothetical protein
MKSEHSAFTTLFDSQAVDDLALRAVLGAAGFRREAIERLVPGVFQGEDTIDEILSIMRQNNAQSSQFARSYGAILRMSCQTFLKFCGCPEHAIEANTDFILKSALQKHGVVLIPDAERGESEKQS